MYLKINRLIETPIHGLSKKTNELTWQTGHVHSLDSSDAGKERR